MMIPYFIIAGCERCGSTSLYENICLHSMVYRAYQKEIEYFDRYYDRGTQWYKQQFSKYHFDGGVTGEATPSYYWHPLTPERIHAFNHKTKIIIITRNKDEAIRSRYEQQRRRNIEVLEFDDAMKYESVRIKGSLERVTSLPYNYFPSLYADYAYKDRYSEKHLEKWKKYFSPLVIRLEDLRDNADQTMGKVFDFLELPFEQYEWCHLNSIEYVRN